MRRALAAVVVIAAAASGALLAGTGGDRRAHDLVVVSVSEPSATGAGGEVATGFAVARGRVVTVAHILEGKRQPVVEMASGHTRQARIVRIDRAADLALLEVRGLPADRLRATDRHDGAALLLVRRGGKIIRLRAGIRRHIEATVHRPDAPTYRRGALELRATVARGDSGAPLVDGNGAVAGVLFARANDRPATAYAVDAGGLQTLLR